MTHLRESAPQVTCTDSPAIIGKFKRLDSEVFISQLSHIRAGLQGKNRGIGKIISASEKRPIACAFSTQPRQS